MILSSNGPRAGRRRLVESAARDDAKQLQQAESLLDRNVKVLVVVPHSSEDGVKIVEAAKKHSFRHQRQADPESRRRSLYISYDNHAVGELQAQYLRNRAPEGNYILLGGAPQDHNAKLIRDGQMAALEDAVKRGDIRIVAEHQHPTRQPAHHTAQPKQQLKNPQQIITILHINNITTRPTKQYHTQKTPHSLQTSSPPTDPTFRTMHPSSTKPT